MQQSTKSKLGTYSLVASTAMACAFEANADIIYTDIDPDSVYTNDGDLYVLDVDGGFQIDIGFRLKHLASYQGVAVYGSYGVMTDYFKTGGALDWFMMASNDYGDMICPNGNFEEGGWMGWSYPSSTGFVGNFAGQGDQYVGFKFYQNNGVHYGWIRVNVADHYDSLTVKDYAYQEIGDSCIRAGVLPSYADTSRNLLLSNLNVAGDETDLVINFDTAADQLGVAEYRVFFIADTHYLHTDLNDLKNSAYFLTYGTTASVSNEAMSLGLRDVNGTFIQGGTTYRFVVMSVPNGVEKTNHEMSVFSNPQTLITFEADTARNLFAQDIANNCNGADFLFEFDTAVDENGIDQYWAIIVKASSLDSFTLEKAEQLNSLHQIFALPTGNNISLQFSSGMLDSDGDSIVVDVPYHFVVMSNANGSTHYSQLSNPSNEITLAGCLSVEDELFVNTMVYLSGQTVWINTDLKGVKVNLVDLNGRVLENFDINSGRKSLNMSGKPRGMYIVTLEHNNRVISRKIIF